MAQRMGLCFMWWMIQYGMGLRQGADCPLILLASPCILILQLRGDKRSIAPRGMVILFLRTPAMRLLELFHLCRGECIYSWLLNSARFVGVP